MSPRASITGLATGTAIAAAKALAMITQGSVEYPTPSSQKSSKALKRREFRPLSVFPLLSLPQALFRIKFSLASIFKHEKEPTQKWSGRAGWRTSPGESTRNCSCAKNIWPRRTATCAVGPDHRRYSEPARHRARAAAQAYHPLARLHSRAYGGAGRHRLLAAES